MKWTRWLGRIVNRLAFGPLIPFPGGGGIGRLSAAAHYLTLYLQGQPGPQLVVVVRHHVSGGMSGGVSSTSAAVRKGQPAPPEHVSMHLDGAEIGLTVDAEKRRVTILGHDVAFDKHNLLVLDGRASASPIEWPMMTHFVRLPLTREPRLLASELRQLDPIRELL